MADNRFDSGPALHLTLNGLRDTAFLACGEDYEPVPETGVVTLVSGISQDALKDSAGELLDVGQDGFKRVVVIGFLTGTHQFERR